MTHILERRRRVVTDYVRTTTEKKKKGAFVCTRVTIRSQQIERSCCWLTEGGETYWNDLRVGATLTVSDPRICSRIAISIDRCILRRIAVTVRAIVALRHFELVTVKHTCPCSLSRFLIVVRSMECLDAKFCGRSELIEMKFNRIKHAKVGWTLIKRCWKCVRISI